jgi:hypothetical protein
LAQLNQIVIIIARAGFRKSEPAELNLPYETPSTLKQITDVYFNELDYDLSEFSKLIALKPKETELIYVGAKNPLDRERKEAIKEVERILKDTRSHKDI